MSKEVNEAMLEIYFSSAVAACFQTIYSARPLRWWKPSAGAEVHFGYDQGWVRIEQRGGEKPAHAEAKCRAELQSAIAESRSGGIERFYFGYFMQYKVVEEMVNKSKFTPNGITGRYLRSEIDVQVNPTTNRSQHETLIRLSRIRGASVSYACGMLFDPAAIYASPNIELLRMVNVDNAVEADFSSWNAGDRHFIYFQNEMSEPIWCSEPRVGESVSVKEWVEAQSVQTAERILTMFSLGREVLDIPEGRPLPFFNVLELEALSDEPRGRSRR
jgi:hypothetical protein